MTAENSGGRKLTEFVSNQVLRHIYWNPGFSVIHRNRESHHFRDDRRTAGISLDHLLLISLKRLLNPLIQFLFNKRTFFD